MGKWMSETNNGWARGSAAVVLALVMVVAALAPASAARIKDLAAVDGVRDNQVMGFGLVGGLAGTGDDPKSAPFTAEAIANMMASFGFQLEPTQIKVKNFAAVMVTADMPAYVSSGDRLDVSISSIGTAKSLEGGQLYQTLLRGADGRVYAVAQGPVSLGSTIGDEGGRESVKTVGRVPGGALIEDTVKSTVVKDDGTVRLNLDQPDFTTADAIVKSIEAVLGPGAALAIDAGTVAVPVPDVYRYNLVPFMAMLENLNASPGTVARVVINQRTGTIVVGQDVTILPVAVTHGSMTLTFGERVRVPGMDREVEVADATMPATGTAVEATGMGTEQPVTVDEGEEGTDTGDYLTQPTSAAEVALGLNRMNLAPGDIVAIFEAIAGAGALLGELEII